MAAPGSSRILPAASSGPAWSGVPFVRPLLAWATSLLLVPGLWGCGSLTDLGSEGQWQTGPRIYGGVQVDWGALAAGAGVSPLYPLLGLVDFPLSFAVDSVLLPVTLPVELARGETPGDFLEAVGDRILGARTLRVGFTLLPAQDPKRPGIVRVTGTLWLKEGNKIRLALEIDDREATQTLLMRGDGRALRIDALGGPPQVGPCPEGIARGYRTLLATTGLFSNRWLPPGELRGLNRGRPPDLVPSEPYWREKLRKVGDPAPRAVAAPPGRAIVCYILRTLPSPMASYTLEVDAASLCPLERTLEGQAGAEPPHPLVREVYPEFLYDPPLPDALFDPSSDP